MGGDDVIWCLGAAVLTAVAAYVRRPDAWLVLRLRLDGGPALRLGRPSGRWRTVVAVLATCALTLIVTDRSTQIAVVAVVVAAGFALRLRRRAAERGRAERFRGDVARLLTAVVAELRAGVDPVGSLHAAVAEADERSWGPVQAAGSADVVPGLRAVAGQPGGESLAEVAAAWHLADQTGSPLATMLDRMAEAVRSEVELAREVGVEAAPARATARLMAMLPVAGLGLGMLLGVNPVRVLVESALGVGCLVLGLALAGLGLWRVERIVAEVEAP